VCWSSCLNFFGSKIATYTVVYQVWNTLLIIAGQVKYVHKINLFLNINVIQLFSVANSRSRKRPYKDKKHLANWLFKIALHSYHLSIIHHTIQHIHFNIHSILFIRMTGIIWYCKQSLNQITCWYRTIPTYKLHNLAVYNLSYSFKWFWCH